ncbi:hypothetical protein [Roseovarius phycicola]|uniref:hypothetical protein n=1 Tax=Roseovarius phycicola TaxID=3080976 RepID=UPI0030CE49FE
MNTILVKTLFFLLGLTGLAWAQEAPRSFCILEPHDQLCPVFPEDQPDFSRFFEYRVVNAPAQAPFDEYAWQAFVALNWDAVRPGSNLHGWRDYARGTEVMRTADPACQASSPETVVPDIRQSDGNTLIDQAGNFIVYEKRMNTVALTYILENELNIPEQRAQFDQKINFPLGVDQDQPASVLIKTAWRILDSSGSEYVEASGLIPIPKRHTLENQDACLSVRLGLVGMHVVAKVQSGNGDKWIWATFEHVDNVPTAQNARDINSLYAQSLFPDGCLPPETHSISDYLLFDATCPDCPTNEAPPVSLLWSETPPLHAIWKALRRIHHRSFGAGTSLAPHRKPTRSGRQNWPGPNWPIICSSRRNGAGPIPIRSSSTENCPDTSATPRWRLTFRQIPVVRAWAAMRALKPPKGRFRISHFY